MFQKLFPREATLLKEKQLCAKGNNYAAPDCDISDSDLLVITFSTVHVDVHKTFVAENGFFVSTPSLNYFETTDDNMTVSPVMPRNLWNHPWIKQMRQITVWFILLNVILGVVGNVFIIALIFRLRKTPSVIDPFLLGIGVCDLYMIWFETFDIVYLPMVTGSMEHSLHNQHNIVC